MSAICKQEDGTPAPMATSTTTARDMRSHDPLWYDAPPVLVAQNRLLEFIPSSHMSLEEQLNAVVRFAVYFWLLMLVLGADYRLIFLPLVVAGATVIFQRHQQQETRTELTGLTRKEHRNEQGDDHLEEYASTSDATSADDVHRHGDDDGDYDRPPHSSEESYSSPTVADVNPIGSNRVPPSFESSQRHAKVSNKCQAPSKHNPFMNVLVSDIRYRPHRPAACTRRQRSDIKQDVKARFEDGLYNNVGDAWGTTNSQRQFFTMPATTIPNDQGGFAQWLYQTEPILKEQGLVQHPHPHPHPHPRTVFSGD